MVPVGCKVIGVRWIYKTKYNEHGELEKCKSRLVAKGYTHKHGIDYTVVYAPIARIETIRIIVALTAQRNWNIFQLDVKSTFYYDVMVTQINYPSLKEITQDNIEQARNRSH